MKYIRVNWRHSEPNEPIILFSELDDSLWETRKVEVFSDGHCGFASETDSNGETRLGIEPLPAFEDIASDPQFELIEISKHDFEETWSQARADSRNT